MFCLTRLGLRITLRWLYLLLYAMQFLGIPLRRENRGFVYTMWYSDIPLRWVYPRLFKYLIVFRTAVLDCALL